eukprot:3209120-Amphidinium_carterae.1
MHDSPAAQPISRIPQLWVQVEQPLKDLSQTRRPRHVSKTQAIKSEAFQCTRQTFEESSQSTSKRFKHADHLPVSKPYFALVL